MSSILDQLKENFKSGSMSVRIIYCNAAVFLLIAISLLIARFASTPVSQNIHFFLDFCFNLQTKWTAFITHPWGLFTSIFAHYSILHLLFNMLMLLGIGRLYEHYLGGRRLLYTYLLGGIAGGLLEIIGQNLGIVPRGMVVGASGAVMAIIFATATYIPKFKISVWGLFDLNLKTLAIILLIFNILSIGANNGTAILAHLGGALIGFLSVKNLNSPQNIVSRTMRLGAKIGDLFKKKPKLKKQKGGGQEFKHTTTRNMSDEEYNLAKRKKQERIDLILGKISKSGYESLTKEEKDFLFQQSKNA